LQILSNPLSIAHEKFVREHIRHARRPDAGCRERSALRVSAARRSQPRDTTVFATSVPAKFSGKDIAIERTPRISEQDVVAFYPYAAADKSYGALIQLDDHGRTALDSLSIERRGGLVFVFINGRPITELQIDKRVSDGKIYIASGLTTADIALMKKDWRSIGQRKK
jgi:hypothetical protein